MGHSVWVPWELGFSSVLPWVKIILQIFSVDNLFWLPLLAASYCGLCQVNKITQTRHFGVRKSFVCKFRCRVVWTLPVICIKGAVSVVPAAVKLHGISGESRLTRTAGEGWGGGSPIAWVAGGSWLSPGQQESLVEKAGLRPWGRKGRAVRCWWACWPPWAAEGPWVLSFSHSSPAGHYSLLDTVGQFAGVRRRLSAAPHVTWRCPEHVCCDEFAARGLGVLGMVRPRSCFAHWAVVCASTQPLKWGSVWFFLL